MSATLDAAAFTRYFEGAKAAYVQVGGGGGEGGSEGGRRTVLANCGLSGQARQQRGAHGMPACSKSGGGDGSSARRLLILRHPSPPHKRAHAPRLQGRQFPVEVMYTAAPQDSYLDAAIAAALQVRAGGG